MSVTVSVYVPCYNAERTIGACLASLLAQRRAPDEILVIDDGSTDKTQQIAKRYPRVRVLVHEKNMGLAEARNTGVRYSKGEFVASIDSDCAADPNWLAVLVGALEADPGLVGVGGSVREAERFTMADRWRMFHMAQHYGRKEKENPRFLFGADTVFRRSALQAAGRYPKQLRTNGEDFEICKRIYLRVPGARMKYIPSAYVHHLRRDSLASLGSTYWRYQTYVGWQKEPQKTLLDAAIQLGRVYKALWTGIVPWDIRHKRWEGLPVALYITWATARLQFRQYLIGRRTAKAAPPDEETPDRAAAS